jgi:hydroxyacyl-ACP dehydratase HTD2-like protein with hotdog domain
VNEARAATVEVNGVQRDWRGSFERLNHEHLGRAGHPARFTVTPEPANAGRLWKSGQLVVESREAIRSFTIGAAVLRLDDVCFAR